MRPGIGKTPFTVEFDSSYFPFGIYKEDRCEDCIMEGECHICKIGVDGEIKICVDLEKNPDYICEV